LEHLRLAVKTDLENITEFYLMAANLLLMKSLKLLPVEMDMSDEFEDRRRELVQKLIEYQRIKKLSDMIGEKEQDAEWIVERAGGQRTLPFADEELWEEIEVWDLLKSFTTIISSLSSERILDLYEEVSVNEKLTLIQEYLDTKKEFLFTDLIIRPESLTDIVCAFLAILEAVKARMIRIYQNTLFGDIRITAAEKRQEEDSGNGNSAD
jgi:segregation and condensation protein A